MLDTWYRPQLLQHLFSVQWSSRLFTTCTTRKQWHTAYKSSCCDQGCACRYITELSHGSVANRTFSAQRKDLLKRKRKRNSVGLYLSVMSLCKVLAGSASALSGSYRLCSELLHFHVAATNGPFCSPIRHFLFFHFIFLDVLLKINGVSFVCVLWRSVLITCICPALATSQRAVTVSIYQLSFAVMCMRVDLGGQVSPNWGGTLIWMPYKVSVCYVRLRVWHCDIML